MRAEAPRHPGPAAKSAARSGWLIIGTCATRPDPVVKSASWVAPSAKGCRQPAFGYIAATMTIAVAGSRPPTTSLIRPCVRRSTQALTSSAPRSANIVACSPAAYQRMTASRKGRLTNSEYLSSMKAASAMSTWAPLPTSQRSRSSALYARRRSLPSRASISSAAGGLAPSRIIASVSARLAGETTMFRPRRQPTGPSGSQAPRRPRGCSRTRHARLVPDKETPSALRSCPPAGKSTAPAPEPPEHAATARRQHAPMSPIPERLA